MKEMKASMDVIRKTAGEMIDQLTEKLEIILEEKQKTELHEKYGILADYMKMKSWMICTLCSTIIHQQIIKLILCQSAMSSLQTMVGICRHITWIDLDLQNFQILQHKEKKYSILSRK